MNSLINWIYDFKIIKITLKTLSSQNITISSSYSANEVALNVIYNTTLIPGAIKPYSFFGLSSNSVVGGAIGYLILLIVNYGLYR